METLETHPIALSTKVFKADLEQFAEMYYAAFPCWMPAVLFSLLPAARTYAFFRRRGHRRRGRAGQCVACGYDLRATPQAGESGGPLLDRCPECGRASTPTPATPVESAGHR